MGGVVIAVEPSSVPASDAAVVASNVGSPSYCQPLNTVA
jgi:hypothetical protein